MLRKIKKIGMTISIIAGIVCFFLSLNTGNPDYNIGMFCSYSLVFLYYLDYKEE